MTGIPVSLAVRVCGILLGLLVLFLVTTRFVEVEQVVGPSMEPALRHGDRVVVDLRVYRRRPPRPGEIALIEGPGGVPLVKRVAAGPLPPGDRIGPLIDPTRREECFRVLGDNQATSADSRSFGPVPRGRFRGRVVARYWPLSRAGAI